MRHHAGFTDRRHVTAMSTNVRPLLDVAAAPRRHSHSTIPPRKRLRLVTYSASEITYIVSSGALNSTHSLTHVKHAVQSNHVVLTKTVLTPTMPPATRESTRALPDVAIAIGQPVLRQTRASHRMRNSVCRRMVTGPDSVTAPHRRAPTAATDTAAQPAVFRHQPKVANDSGTRSESTATMDVDASTLILPSLSPVPTTTAGITETRLHI